MGKLEKITTVKMPAYALGFLINDNTEGMTDAELIELSNTLHDEFPNYTMLSFEIHGEPEFHWRPFFGLACEVYDCDVWGHRK